MVRPKIKQEEEEDQQAVEVDERGKKKTTPAASEENFDSTLCQMSETLSTEKNDRLLLML